MLWHFTCRCICFCVLSSAYLQKSVPDFTRLIEQWHMAISMSIAGLMTDFSLPYMNIKAQTVQRRLATIGCKTSIAKASILSGLVLLLQCNEICFPKICGYTEATYLWLPFICISNNDWFEDLRSWLHTVVRLSTKSLIQVHSYMLLTKHDSMCRAHDITF